MSDAGNVNLGELSDELVLEIRATIREAKSEGVSGLVSGAGVIGDVLKKVETIGRNFSLGGAGKKELAVLVINKLVDVPYIPEALEAFGIDKAIDLVLAVLNRIFGKGWLDKVAS